MKTLIEDYKRRLATAEKMLDDMKKSHVQSVETRIRIETKASEYRSIIAELERALNFKLKSYEDLWVIQSYAGSDIDFVYTDKEEAEKAAEEQRNEFIAHYRKVNKRMDDEEWERYAKRNYSGMYKVVTLDRAIDNIKDDIRDGYDSHGDPSY